MPDILFARIKNSTNENICVYGPPMEGDTNKCNNNVCDNSRYILKPGQTTPLWWDCDGFQLPNDRYYISNGRGPIKGPAAIKYSDLKSVEIFKEGSNYKCVGSTDDGFFHAGQVNWFIRDSEAAFYQKTFDSRYDVPS
ncbi:hypothetical protein BK771_33030 [Bacillus thuringiensis serovar ostriniae]|uniref:Uncharacterized protein n=1 Tax=Bacillus wiedmannii TaxID=1890302 RepID=A0A242YYR8_9BACI|nr:MULTISPECIES: hypothetical protein [Bacillus cereus group]OTX84889.1 hypothetical protein BK730_24245 [Bacillus wiedmannii]OTZ80692.1 hypothetical protein BK771_33030 [Bacillus thuringiensis serovar ostriniae]